MKAPFTYFGGKSKIAPLIWQAFGDVDHYAEPFSGSCAVLLSRPEEHKRKAETINDADGFIANFWRAVSKDPDGVATHAERMVSEVDLVAINNRLFEARNGLTERLKSDDRFFDSEIAGLWLYGVNAWIGKGFCSVKTKIKKPSISSIGQGINRIKDRHRVTAVMRQLHNRFRHVRVLCGDWTRLVSSPSCVCAGQTNIGFFLDPPYAADRTKVYAHDSFDNSKVLDFCKEWESKIKIAVTGYDGEYDLHGWRKTNWVGGRGYSSAAKKNRFKETIWFSPLCNA